LRGPCEPVRARAPRKLRAKASLRLWLSCVLCGRRLRGCRIWHRGRYRRPVPPSLAGALRGVFGRQSGPQPSPYVDALTCGSRLFPRSSTAAMGRNGRSRNCWNGWHANITAKFICMPSGSRTSRSIVKRQANRGNPVPSYGTKFLPFEVLICCNLPRGFC